VVKTRRVASGPHGMQGMRNGGRPCSLLGASVVWHRYNPQRLGLRPMSAAASFVWRCLKGLDGRIDDPNAGWKGRGIVDLERRPRALDAGRR
jgi:hypothetical protein